MTDDDYLWDGTGTPDPEVKRLEQLLGRLRATAPSPMIPAAIRRTPDATIADGTATATVLCWRTARFLAPALAAAAAIALMIGVTYRSTGSTASWAVAWISGQPRVGLRTLAGEGRIAVGQTLTTDGASRARLNVSTIGSVTVGTNTRVRLVETRDAHHQLALERGTLHAFIVAPPGQFVVDTPSATATDLGCVYDLTVDEGGAGLLSVVAGWVAFEEGGRESFVPAGASCRTDAKIGPGTPRYDDADERFRDELDRFDYSGDLNRQAAAMFYVLEHARERDAMTLWHMIPRVDAKYRGAVIDALAKRVPMPASITRDAVQRLDRAALDRWWDALSLGDAGWWRNWKAPVTEFKK